MSSNYFYEKHKHSLVAVLSITLVVRSIALPAIIFADDITASPTPAPTVTPTESPTPSPTTVPLSSPEPSIIPLPSVTPAPSPRLDPSPTPDPSIIPSPEPASASATPIPLVDLAGSAQNTSTPSSTNQANPSVQTNNPAAPSPTVTPSPLPSPLLNFVNTNKASDSASISAISTTGNNTQNSLDAALLALATGNATAYASLLNLININVLDSQYQVLLINITPETIGTIDINSIWRQLLADAANSTPSSVPALSSANQTQLNQTVQAVANSGSNQVQSTGDTGIRTGDATAIASAVTVANSNLIHSHLLITLINVLPGSTASIIIPRPDLFTAPTGTTPSLLTFFNENNVLLNSTISATALTGSNAVYGASTSLLTGNATAYTNMLNFNNLNLSNQQLFSWIFTTPLQSTTQTVGSGLPVFSSDKGISLADSSIERTQTYNQATVNSVVSATANTGDNHVSSQGNADVTTGNAFALANVLNFVNVNLFHSNWLMGLTNIIGSWTGQVMYAYPDLALSITPIFTSVQPGDTVSFEVGMQNKGNDVAHHPVVTITLPVEMTYVDQSCAYPQDVIGQTITWQLPDMPADTTTQCIITGKVSPNISFTHTQASAIIQQVYASDTESSKIMSVHGTIETSDPEINIGNNQASGQFTVYSTTSSTSNDQLPELTISAVNNVNQFVYPGDTVTFFIDIRNTGAGVSSNSHLVQILLDENGNQLGKVDFSIGTINPGKGGRLTFGWVMPKTALTGVRITSAYAYGDAENGSRVSSNESTTHFLVKNLIKLSNQPTLAQSQVESDQTPSVLGTITNAQKPFNPLPYIAGVVLSSLWFAVIRYRIHQHTVVTKTVMGLISLVLFGVTLYSFYTVGTHIGFVRPFTNMVRALPN